VYKSTRLRSAGRWTRSPTSGIAQARCCRAASKRFTPPGPEEVHYAFWREQSPAVLFCPDLIMRDADGDLAFIPAEYHDDPQATRDSVRRLLDLPFDVLCMDHGAPITANPHAAL
jgi:hypothetical protein